MKQFFLKKFAIAAIVLCAAPATLLAQEKEKEKAKDKKDHQQIVITRSGDKNEKTVIEIDGDKVKVNGKDVADLKDIQVHINDWKMPNITRLRTPGPGSTYSMVMDDHNAFFKVDSNRAMLGINTDGHDKGAEIESVVTGSGAEKAGLKKGDVITKIDSRKIDAAEDVTDAVRAHKPGDKITITYLRDNKENKATAELGRWKGIDVRGMTAPKILNDQVWRESQHDRTFDRAYPSVQGNFSMMNTNRPKLGLSVQDTDDGKGVKVLEMDDDGNAAKAGIKEDDIITQIDDKVINSADEIAKIMKEKKDQPVVRFHVNRSGKSQTIEVKIPRKLKTADL